jgi:hypothetical protein
VERPAHASRSALLIARIGDRQCVGVDLDHRVDGRAAPVDLLDAREIPLGDRPRRPRAGAHGVLKLGDGGFFQLERGARVPSGQGGARGTRGLGERATREGWSGNGAHGRGSAVTKECAAVHDLKATATGKGRVKVRP